jgi:putative endopeptidase
VADLGGTTLAYIAWKAASKGRTSSHLADSRPSSASSSAWRKWACGDERPENKRLNAVTNEHSPLEDRINGVVANLPQFRQAFSCQAGQPMALQNACRVRQAVGRAFTLCIDKDSPGERQF